MQAGSHDDRPNGVTALTVADPRARAELGEFVARVVQLDPVGTVRLLAAQGAITAWAMTPFEVLATRAVPGALAPADVAVPAVALLTALTVERSGTVDPGGGARWRAELPPDTGWGEPRELPAERLAELAEDGLAAARDDPHGPSAELLDRVALHVPEPTGPAVRIPLRCLFALSGLGLLDDPAPILLTTTRNWLRLDTTRGAVVRRRVLTLPLLS